MKRLFTFFLSLMAVASASAELTLVWNGNEVTKDTTITVSEAVEDPISGEVVMNFSGTISNVTDFKVTITRQSEDLVDEFCAAGKCTGSNDELTQTLSFTTSAPIADWYAHFLPTVKGDYQYSYKFEDASRSLTLKVNYHYTGANLQRAMLINQFSLAGTVLKWQFDTSFARTFALYNALGKRLCEIGATTATGSYDLSGYPRGVYIVTLNEGVDVIATKKIVIK